MADAGIKKVTVLKSDIKTISGNEQGYVVRYRIISEDKNRSSHWSPQYKLSAAPQTTINYSINVDNTYNTATVVWQNVPDIKEYDIYIKWDNTTWNYVTSVATTSYAALTTGHNSIQLAVQVPTFPKARFAGATLFEIPSTSV
jgi:hypothetical protein